MSTVLAGIDLGDAVWTDRLRWTALEQIEQPTLGGRMVVGQRRLIQGRNITLECWLLEADLRILCGMRDSGSTMVLNIQGQPFSVLFRHSDTPIDYEALDYEVDVPDDSDLHFVTLRLMAL